MLSETLAGFGLVRPIAAPNGYGFLNWSGNHVARLTSAQYFEPLPATFIDDPMLHRLCNCLWPSEMVPLNALVSRETCDMISDIRMLSQAEGRSNITHSQPTSSVIDVVLPVNPFQTALKLLGTIAQGGDLISSMTALGLPIAGEYPVRHDTYRGDCVSGISYKMMQDASYRFLDGLGIGGLYIDRFNSTVSVLNDTAFRGQPLVTDQVNKRHYSRLPGNYLFYESGYRRYNHFDGKCLEGYYFVDVTKTDVFPPELDEIFLGGISLPNPISIVPGDVYLTDYHSNHVTLYVDPRSLEVNMIPNVWMPESDAKSIAKGFTPQYAAPIATYELNILRNAWYSPIVHREVYKIALGITPSTLFGWFMPYYGGPFAQIQSWGGKFAEGATVVYSREQVRHEIMSKDPSATPGVGSTWQYADLGESNDYHFVGVNNMPVPTGVGEVGGGVIPQNGGFNYVRTKDVKTKRFCRKDAEFDSSYSSTVLLEQIAPMGHYALADAYRRLDIMTMNNLENISQIGEMFAVIGYLKTVSALSRISGQRNKTSAQKFRQVANVLGSGILLHEYGLAPTIADGKTLAANWKEVTTAFQRFAEQQSKWFGVQGLHQATLPPSSICPYPVQAVAHAQFKARLGFSSLVHFLFGIDQIGLLPTGGRALDIVPGSSFADWYLTGHQQVNSFDYTAKGSILYETGPFVWSLNAEIDITQHLPLETQVNMTGSAPKRAHYVRFVSRYEPPVGLSSVYSFHEAPGLNKLVSLGLVLSSL